MDSYNNCYNISASKEGNLLKLFYLYFFCKKLIEKSNQEKLKVIKNTLSKKSENPENLNK